MPKCENCLLSAGLKCQPPHRKLTQCLKEVNNQLEPSISMTALRNLVGDEPKPLKTSNNGVPSDSQPSISELLAGDDDLKFKIETCVPLHDSHNSIVAYLISFKDGGKTIFRP